MLQQMTKVPWKQISEARRGNSRRLPRSGEMGGVSHEETRARDERGAVSLGMCSPQQERQERR